MTGLGVSLYIQEVRCSRENLVTRIRSATVVLWLLTPAHLPCRPLDQPLFGGGPLPLHLTLHTHLPCRPLDHPLLGGLRLGRRLQLPRDMQS